MSHKSQKPDGRGGTYFLLPHCLTKSEAFRTASPRAIKLLFVLWSKHNGFNNGKLSCSLSQLAEGMDSQNHRGNSRAIAELQSRGIVAMARDYPRAYRLAREYRLTFIPSISGPPTHDYLQWRPGDMGTRKKAKFRGAASATRKQLSSADSTKDGKVSAANFEAVLRQEGENSVFRAEGTLGKSAAHIVSHIRSHSTISEDGLGSPSEEALRERALAFIGIYARGSQRRLAQAARIPEGTFSKFLRRGGSLSSEARMRLTCAFLKAAATERGHQLRSFENRSL